MILYEMVREEATVFDIVTTEFTTVTTRLLADVGATFTIKAFAVPPAEFAGSVVATMLEVE